MLQFMFNEPYTEPEGAIAELHSVLRGFTDHLSHFISENKDKQTELRKYEIWTCGLSSSLTELTSSLYAANQFKDRIQAKYVHEMNVEEKLNYDRYVYFDKNGFIRVFSMLDKIGTFLDGVLNLNTAEVKPHFSYFTVLRRMREKKLHPALSIPINNIKDTSRECLNRLRDRRNTEIHYMNSEMKDDLIQMTRLYGQEIRLENLDEQQHDLTVGVHMVIESLKLSILYVDQLLVNRNLPI